MARYTFTCEHFDYDMFRGEENGVASKHTTEFRADDLTTMLENFELFLRGAGFQFDGVIDVVNPDANDDIFCDADDEEPVIDSKVMEHMVADLLRQQENQELHGKCEVCGIDKQIMAVHKCYDYGCPIYSPKN